MVEDVKRESEGEVIWTKKLEKAIRRKSGEMFRNCYYKFQ